MKKYLAKTTSAFIIILTLIITAIPFASAATVLDESKKVSVTLNCSKPGYTFELFRVADLKTTSGTTNENVPSAVKEYLDMKSDPSNPKRQEVKNSG